MSDNEAAFTAALAQWLRNDGWEVVAMDAPHLPEAIGRCAHHEAVLKIVVLTTKNRREKERLAKEEEEHEKSMSKASDEL